LVFYNSAISTATDQCSSLAFLSSSVYPFHNISINLSFYLDTALFKLAPPRYAYILPEKLLIAIKPSLIILTVASNNMQFNNIVQVIFSSPATVAIIVAYFLDATMSPAHASTRRDSGRHWWEKFRSYNQDIRSDEFYALPMRLNRFFPSY
jgi:hypothetical protein